MNLAILDPYCGDSGKIGFYNNQDIGLAKAFIKIGYKVTIIYPDKKIRKVRIVQESPDILIVYCPAFTIGVHSFFDLRILIEYKIDILQLNGDNQLFVPEIINFCKKNNILQYNYIGTIKSDSNSSLKLLLSKLFLKKNMAVYKQSKCFVKTPSVKNDLREQGISNIDIAPVGLDLSIIPSLVNFKETVKKFNIPTDKKILLFIGRMEKYKNPLAALKLINTLNNDYHLIMVGTGSLNNIVSKFIYDHELDNKVTRILSINNSEIHSFYKISDYYVNFNENEIFGMAILEAMYQGTDVIAIKAPGPSFIIENNISGFLANNIEEMTKIINSNKHLESNVIKKRVINQFTWDSTAKNINEWILNTTNY